MITALKGINFDFYIEEFQDGHSGELIFIINVCSLEDLLKVYYKFVVLKHFKSREIKIKDESKEISINLDSNISYRVFYNYLNRYIKNKNIELLDKNISCSVELNNYYALNYSISIPGYAELGKGNDTKVLKDYNLI